MSQGLEAPFLGPAGQRPTSLWVKLILHSPQTHLVPHLTSRRQGGSEPTFALHRRLTSLEHLCGGPPCRRPQGSQTEPSQLASLRGTVTTSLSLVNSQASVTSTVPGSCSGARSGVLVSVGNPVRPRPCGVHGCSAAAGSLLLHQRFPVTDPGSKFRAK